MNLAEVYREAALKCAELAMDPDPGASRDYKGLTAKNYAQACLAFTQAACTLTQPGRKRI